MWVKIVKLRKRSVKSGQNNKIWSKYVNQIVMMNHRSNLVTVCVNIWRIKTVNIVHKAEWVCQILWQPNWVVNENFAVNHEPPPRPLFSWFSPRQKTVFAGGGGWAPLGQDRGSIGQKFMMDCVQSCCRVAHFDAKYVESAEKAERSCSELGLEHYILIGSYTHPHQHAIFALNDNHDHHYPACWSIR